MFANDLLNQAYYFFSDSSSGYDSAESWDTDSLSSRDGDSQSLPPCDSDSQPLSSCDIERDFTRCCKIEPEVMKISSTTNLCESLDLILSMPDMCDVTFLVGAEEIPVHGLKAVLSVRSR